VIGGAVVVDHMVLQAPPGLLSIHTNMSGIFSSRHCPGRLFRRT
jgi:hypothetical protein